jgi:hypothetical protein
MFFLIRESSRQPKGNEMPTRRRSLFNRLVRALPVVLAAAPGIIDAVQQTRRALREPGATPREPAPGS